MPDAKKSGSHVGFATPERPNTIPYSTLHPHTETLEEPRMPYYLQRVRLTVHTKNEFLAGTELAK